MVGGIHNYAADSRADALMTAAAGLADLDILVLFVANYTYGSRAVGVYHPDFAAGQPDLNVIIFFSYQLGAGAGSAH
jgi:hypothetical protein